MSHHKIGHTPSGCGSKYIPMASTGLPTDGSAQHCDDDEEDDEDETGGNDAKTGEAHSVREPDDMNDWPSHAEQF